LKRDRTIEMIGGAAGIQADRIVNTLDCCLALPEAPKRNAPVRMIVGDARVDGNGAVHQLDGLPKIADLSRDDPEQLKNLRIPRLELQDLFVAGLRLRELSAPVRILRLCEQSTQAVARRRGRSRQKSVSTFAHRCR
jgi:hypothetical protein